MFSARTSQLMRMKYPENASAASVFEIVRYSILFLNSAVSEPFSIRIFGSLENPESPAASPNAFW